MKYTKSDGGLHSYSMYNAPLEYDQLSVAFALFQLDADITGF